MAKEPRISFQDLEVGKLEALLLKVQPLLEAEDFQLLDRVITTLVLVLDCIQKKNMSIRRLLRMIFGPKTESSRNLLRKDKDQAAAPNGQSSACAGSDSPPAKIKRKGHGRNGAEDYTGAQRIFVAHEEFQAGDLCPLCPEGGRLYDTRQPGLFIRVVAQPIFRGTIYELMKLRCNLCGAVFTARAPAEAGTSKYSQEVPSMLAILRYSNGRSAAVSEPLTSPVHPPSSLDAGAPPASFDLSLIHI